MVQSKAKLRLSYVYTLGNSDTLLCIGGSEITKGAKLQMHWIEKCNDFSGEPLKRLSFSVESAVLNWKHLLELSYMSRLVLKWKH